MRKNFVLDTNVLLHNPDAIHFFEDNQVIIPLAVIEEIDNQKRRQDEVGANAREVSRRLDAMRQTGKLSEGVALPNGGTLRIEINHRRMEVLPESLDVLDASKPDNRILAVALNLSHVLRDEQVVLVSKDLNLRLKADVLGVKAEDLIRDKVDFRKLYSGQSDIAVGKEEMDAFFTDRSLAVPEGEEGDLLPHQFVVLKNAVNPSASALARLVDGNLIPLKVTNTSRCFGLRARNKEQLFALELLLDPEVKVVTLAGGAGTGKTLLALAAGLEQTMENELYSKLLVTRPVIPLDGQDLGFLPGDKQEKIRPWMQPIFDNIEYLFRFSQQDFYMAGKRLAGGEKDQVAAYEIGEYLAYTGQMELEALTYIRGRSIPQQFILVDEAQNCTAHAVKTLLTRVGEGSKIVFTGDIGQIDHPYLDSASNGFTQLVEKLKGTNLAGHINLTKGERSEVAELGAKLL
jgi:PhoH-like ATPase